MALTTPFVNDADLKSFLPDVLSFGVATFAPQNLRASDDVFERLVAEWWPQAIGGFYGLSRASVDIQWPVLPAMDIALVNTAALVTLTAYRALGHYVMPLISSDADANGDLFTRRAARYERFYDEEWAKVINLPLYDFNADGSFTTIERALSVSRRLRRA